jgi:hypothetical protein
MKRCVNYSVAVALFAVVIVFGLAVLMIVKGYGPEVIIPIVTGTSLATGDLVRRLHLSTSTLAEPDRTAGGDHDSTVG